MIRRLVLSVVLAATAASAESKRIAIVVGNNAGSAELTPLRYAESDAGKMARVLIELGDVGMDDVLLLQGRKVGDLERAIADAKERVQHFKRSPETRTVLIFYFSGHSDGEAIELGQEKLPYGRLKSMLQGTGADLRVAIVDACKSGGGFLQKGGKPAEAFTIKLTDTLVASGDAFITSSAADESALESSEVMGSFFTHNLISGLRGAADASGDKLVTLAEAYRYAFDRTVSATAMMPVGAQHPSYDYRLSGQGELVLSSLVKPSASLILPDGADRSMISDLARDQVVVEVSQGSAKEIALAPGTYGLRLFKGGTSWGGRVVLPEGARKAIKWEELSALTSSVVVAAKGGPPAATVGKEAQMLPPDDPLVFTAEFGGIQGIIPTPNAGVGPTNCTLAPSLCSRGLDGMARLGFEPRMGPGVAFSLLGTTSFSAVSESALQARIGYRWAWQLGPVWLSVGAEAGAAYVWQSTSAGVNGTFAGAFAPRVGARLKLGGPFWLTLNGDVSILLLRLDDQLQAIVSPSLGVGLAVAF